jgi:hypothetical protein
MALSDLFAKLRFEGFPAAASSSPRELVRYSSEHHEEELTALAAKEAKAGLIWGARERAREKALVNAAEWAQAWGESLAYKGRVPVAKGQRKSLVKMISHFTAEGEELVIHALRVLRGEMIATIVNTKGDTLEIGPSIADQAEARKFLADRLWGRAPEKIEIGALGSTADDAPDLSALTPDELKAALTLARKLAPASEQIVDVPVQKEDSA